MFNEEYAEINGEYKFYMNIKDNINIIFDVGSNKESLFIDF